MPNRDYTKVTFAYFGGLLGEAGGKNAFDE
ncbi:MAG: hypothetical protein QOE34_1443 [Verrucomicrobiota bacterium]|jgi:hypothetical protein